MGDVAREVPEGNPSSDILKHDAGRSSASSHGENRDTENSNTSHDDASAAPSLSPNLHQYSTENDKIDALFRYLRTELAPLVDQYISQPSTDPKVREFEHDRLELTIMKQVLIKANSISDDARVARRALTQEARGMLNRLNAFEQQASHTSTLAPNSEDGSAEDLPSEESASAQRLEKEHNLSRQAAAELDQNLDSPSDLVPTITNIQIQIQRTHPNLSPEQVAKVAAERLYVYKQQQQRMTQAAMNTAVGSAPQELLEEQQNTSDINYDDEHSTSTTAQFISKMQSSSSLSSDGRSPKHRRRRRKPQPTLGDAVLIGFLAPNRPDIARQAGE